MKQIEYSLRYIALVIIGYYLLFKDFYVLNYQLLAVIPLNFLCIRYGIYYKINKDNYVTKEYILLELVSLTTLFNVIFLLLNKVNIFVVIIVVIINILELVYTTNIKQKKSK